ncbi:SMI1/KNR4 family protein [Asanoa iriomotensis]|uniref:Knr4/Smi1-like domain-containing protein n=1 Tax=Asanoa iriomotensis TaxID=234613 RepID=A0ABQ4C7Y6_9ACTN|nr:SMI1/KNR4 family protein [Asanoa iriomotensis]GIF58891.1 hypothetical protein Air01nite_49860 [Asanoa iriomotensis]
MEVAEAWARVEAGLGRVLPASLSQLQPGARPEAIDAMESALGVTLPPDFRASLLIHDGTAWTNPGTGRPSPIPLEYLYDTTGIVAATRMWRDNYDPDLAFDAGPVRAVVGLPSAVLVGDMNGDVRWYLDLDPPPGGTPGQVVRVDIECEEWDVLAPSWTGLLLRYADDLHRHATDPANSPLDIDQGLGPACEWGRKIR